MFEDIPQRQQIDAPRLERRIEKGALVQLETIVIARKRAHPPTRLTAMGLVTSRLRHGQERASCRADVQHAFAGKFRRFLDAIETVGKGPLTKSDLGNELLVRRIRIALQDQIARKSWPNVDETTVAAPDGLVHQRLVRRGAEDDIEVDRLGEIPFQRN